MSSEEVISWISAHLTLWVGILISAVVYILYKIPTPKNGSFRPASKDNISILLTGPGIVSCGKMLIFYGEYNTTGDIFKKLHDICFRLKTYMEVGIILKNKHTQDIIEVYNIFLLMEKKFEDLNPDMIFLGGAVGLWLATSEIFKKLGNKFIYKSSPATITLN